MQVVARVSLIDGSCELGEAEAVACCCRDGCCTPGPVVLVVVVVVEEFGVALIVPETAGKDGVLLVVTVVLEVIVFVASLPIDGIGVGVGIGIDTGKTAPVIGGIIFVQVGVGAIIDDGGQ